MSNKNSELTTTNKSVSPEERGKRAFELESKIKEVKYAIGYNFLEMGKYLREIYDNCYYQELGFSSMSEWLSEASISNSWAWTFMDIYQIFVLEHKIPQEKILEVDYTKLSQIVPVIKQNPEDAEKWLEAATSLRRIDLQREIRESKLEQQRNDIKEKNSLQDLGSKIIEGKIIEENIFDNELKSIKLDAIITQDERNIENWVGLLDTKIKDDTAVLVCCNKKSIAKIQNDLEDCGFKIFDIIIWQKENYEKPITLTGLTQRCEFVVVAGKKKPKYLFPDVKSDLWKISNEKNLQDNEKPRLLINDLIEMVTFPGDTILDPNATSLTVYDVGTQLERTVYAIKDDEISKCP